MECLIKKRMNISSYLVSMRFAPILAQAAGGLAEGASKAVGIVMLNPLVIEKAPVDAEVMRLTRLKKQHAESL